jgi:CheY-like chemotaxis protein
MLLKVFYLDDEKDLTDIFVELFSNEQVEIIAFNDPKKAILESHKQKPDLIFLDYRLPGTTGEVVALSMPANIPKYLITGDLIIHNSKPYQEILRKPFDFNMIEMILGKALAA